MTAGDTGSPAQFSQSTWDEGGYVTDNGTWQKHEGLGGGVRCRWSPQEGAPLPCGGGVACLRPRAAGLGSGTDSTNGCKADVTPVQL